MDARVGGFGDFLFTVMSLTKRPSSARIAQYFGHLYTRLANTPSVVKHTNLTCFDRPFHGESASNGNFEEVDASWMHPQLHCIYLLGVFLFCQVVFYYPHRPETKVLQRISLTIRRGQKVALVGYSGSGKSTVIQLLLRRRTRGGAVWRTALQCGVMPHMFTSKELEPVAQPSGVTLGTLGGRSGSGPIFTVSTNSRFSTS